MATRLSKRGLSAGRGKGSQKKRQKKKKENTKKNVNAVVKHQEGSWTEKAPVCL